MTVFDVARLRRPALIALYFRTCIPRWGTGGTSDMAEHRAAGMSREQLTAAIVTTWETA
jgi:hypothetical protein